MPAKKLPWRTLVTSEGPAGRFTREEYRKAVQEVKALRAAQAARAKRRSAPGRQAATL
jgi:hypothetical protein